MCEEAHARAIEFEIEDPDNNPKVRDAKAAFDAARQDEDDPSEVYDHLYRFFSRYYHKGDILSRRYHVAENGTRAAPYAVPDDGREVYLHWANKDRYYIKSTETLRNFTFDLGAALHKEASRQRTTLDLAAPDSQPLRGPLQPPPATSPICASRWRASIDRWWWWASPWAAPCSRISSGRVGRSRARS